MVWRMERPWVGSVLIGLAVLAAYAGSLKNGFTFDDRGLVLENPLVVERRWGETFTTSYWWGNTGEKDGLYRPLTIASFSLNQLLSGPGPTGFHFVNIVLHGIGAIGLYLLGRSFIGISGGFLAGLLFGLHPGLSEAVNSIVGRAELLAFCLGLFGVWTWLQGKRNRGWYLLSGVLLVASQLAKENGVCFGLGLAVCGFFESRKRWEGWAGPLLAVGTGLGIKMAVTGMLRPEVIGFIDNPLAYADVLVRGLNGIHNLGQYLLLLVYPWPLSADYSFDQIPVVEGLFAVDLVFPLLFILTLGTIIAGLAVNRPHMMLWTVSSGGALLLVSNILLPVGTVFAERLIYLPAAGFCLGAGWALGSLEKKQIFLVMGLWVIISGALVQKRTADWRDDLALFTSASRISPRSARSHYGLGLAYHRQEQLALALEAYDRALEIYPRFADAHFNRGAALLSLGQKEEAKRAYQRASESRPGYVKALYACGVIEGELGNWLEAEKYYRQVQRWEPGHLGGTKELAFVLWRQGRKREAIEVLQDGLDGHPQNGVLRELLERMERQ